MQCMTSPTFCIEDTNTQPNYIKPLLQMLHECSMQVKPTTLK